MLGLLADLPRTNRWTIAEHAGDASPDGMQYLLARAVWDHDAVRDDVRAYLVSATDAGHAMIDRDLYVPQGWIDHPERCRAAGIPARSGLRPSRPWALAQAMIARALDAGVPATWVTGDEVYGACPGLRAELEARGIGYVLAVACDHPVRAGGATQRADTLLRCVPARAWQCSSAGRGAKGHRHYDWALLFAALVAVPSLTPDTGCAGRRGDDDSKPAPGAATTDNRPADHEDHDLRLEY